MTNNQLQTDIIIVGQGLAGTLLAHVCMKANKRVLVIDSGNTNTSSHIAAGMFTPVSGKRMTLTPDAEVLLQQSIFMYQEMEALLGVRFLHEQPIYHAFGSVKEQNDLMTRMDNPGFSKYVDVHPIPENSVNQPHGAFEVNGSGWVDTSLLLNSFREYLNNNNALLEESFDYSLLNINDDGGVYKEYSAKQIVFCEGYLMKNNPYFKHIEVIPCKGDVLTIECEGGPKNHIVKKGCYMVNTKADLYRVGSTYVWGNDDTTVSEEGKELLNEKLRDMITLPFNIMEHRVGIRPTTKDRKPIAVQHPAYKNMFALNGLGTKGVMQGPHWAGKMMEMLLKTG